MDAVPMTQHEPMGFKQLKAALTPRIFPFRIRYTLNIADWKNYTCDIDAGIV